MSDSTPTASRGPSRSAKLVAACRMLAAELPEHERLIDDPFAHLVVDDRAVAAARADGFKIVPLCPFVNATRKKHPEWADVFV